MKIIAVIPARYDSKRLPGKALMQLRGKSVLQHVYERVLESGVFNEIVIATDDERIKEAAENFEAQVIITRRNCCNGSERAAEVITDKHCEIVVNIQADQLFLPVEIVKQTVQMLVDEPDLQIATPIYLMDNAESFNNPNIVKTIIDINGFAIYFSRLPIPYTRNREEDQNLFYKHIGIYAYRKQFLLKYVQFGPSSLEKLENLEQLRIIENGHKIKTVIVSQDSISIDTKEDLKRLKIEDAHRASSI